MWTWGLRWWYGGVREVAHKLDAAVVNADSNLTLSIARDNPRRGASGTTSTLPRIDHHNATVGEVLDVAGRQTGTSRLCDRRDHGVELADRLARQFA